jgi:hypothetical protein
MPRKPKTEANYQPIPKELLDQWVKGPGARDCPTSVVRSF